MSEPVRTETRNLFIEVRKGLRGQLKVLAKGSRMNLSEFCDHVLAWAVETKMKFTTTITKQP